MNWAETNLYFKAATCLKSHYNQIAFYRRKNSPKKHDHIIKDATLLKMKALVSNYIGLNADAIYK